MFLLETNDETTHKEVFLSNNQSVVSALCSSVTQFDLICISCHSELCMSLVLLLLLKVVGGTAASTHTHTHTQRKVGISWGGSKYFLTVYDAHPNSQMVFLLEWMQLNLTYLAVTCCQQSIKSMNSEQLITL